MTATTTTQKYIIPSSEIEKEERESPFPIHETTIIKELMTIILQRK